MAAFNAVRFRVKPGREQEFLDAHANSKPRLERVVVGGSSKASGCHGSGRRSTFC